VGRRLAAEHGVVLKLDVSGFDTYRLHRYSLWPFRIDAQFASPDEVAAARKHEYSRPRGVLARLSGSRVLPGIFRERVFTHDSTVDGLPDGIYLDGYWQSEKYFRDITDLLREELALKQEPRGRNQDTADEIMTCEAASIHVRRGDYVSDPTARRVYTECTVDYYLKCMVRLRELVPKVRFFVFSDAPEWVKAHFPVDAGSRLVSHNGADRNYEDLRLMSLCRHHIIANSTFGWWGAWLGRYPGKIVLAPSRWFATTELDCKDLVPDDWLRT